MQPPVAMQLKTESRCAQESDLDWHQQLWPFHTPCDQGGKPKKHPLGCTTRHPTCREVIVLLMWVPSAKGGMGYLLQVHHMLKYSESWWGCKATLVLEFRISSAGHA